MSVYTFAVFAPRLEYFTFLHFTLCNCKMCGVHTAWVSGVWWGRADQIICYIFSHFHPIHPRNMESHQKWKKCYNLIFLNIHPCSNKCKAVKSVFRKCRPIDRSRSCCCCPDGATNHDVTIETVTCQNTREHTLHTFYTHSTHILTHSPPLHSCLSCGRYVLCFSSSWLGFCATNHMMTGGVTSI